MTYSGWFEAHAKKHREIMLKLKDLSEDEVIAYFRYENMVEKEPGFCPLYTAHKKCHDMEALNCYLCACPNFRFDDEGIRKTGERTLFSYCSVNAKEGRQFVSGKAIHQDCSGCTIPHREAYIRKHFSRDWDHIMAHSNQSSI